MMVRPDVRDSLSPFQIYCVGEGAPWHRPAHGLVRLTYGEHIDQLRNASCGPTCPLCGLTAMIPDQFTDEQPRIRCPELKEII